MKTAYGKSKYFSERRIEMLNKAGVKILSILLLISVTGCIPAYTIRYDETFSGKVVDAETGEPVEGVVVLGVWYVSMIYGLKYYDARETVTGKNGEFSIPGKGLRIMSNLEPVTVMIFKAGYRYVEGTWKSFKEGFYYKDKIKWEGDMPIIPLQKLTMKQRRRRGSPHPPPDKAPLEKVILMLKEIDKNDIELGLEPRGIWRGEEYE